MNIKDYTEENFEEINNWWKFNNLNGFTKDFIPSTSFIIENENDCINYAFISLILTNIKEYCYLENLIGNPNIEKSIRREYVQQLIKYAEYYAKSLGYKKLMCMSNTEKLKNYYQSLGYLPTIDNVSCFIKEL